MCDTSVTENVTGRPLPGRKRVVDTEKETLGHVLTITNITMFSYSKAAVTEDTLLIDIPCIYFWR
jgi:hypothetical protein